MNPPFANGKDVDHIRLAWSMLKPGGRLVAICCEGPFFRDDRKSAEFRDWLDEIGAVTRRVATWHVPRERRERPSRLILAHKPGQAEDDAPAT